MSQLKYVNGRIISGDTQVAIDAARLIRAAKDSGRQLSLAGSLIAATARVAGLCLVTRNGPDFENQGLELHKPWT